MSQMKFSIVNKFFSLKVEDKYGSVLCPSLPYFSSRCSWELIPPQKALHGSLPGTLCGSQESAAYVHISRSISYCLSKYIYIYVSVGFGPLKSQA